MDKIKKKNMKDLIVIRSGNEVFGVPKEKINKALIEDTIYRSLLNKE